MSGGLGSLPRMKSRPLSRRRFLEATAVASAPFILPSGILSAKVKPNDKISVGFIGMGIQNRGLQNRFMADSNVVAVAVAACPFCGASGADSVEHRDVCTHFWKCGVACVTTTVTFG